MNRTDVLSLALKLTTQNREHEHGVFRENAAVASKMISGFLGFEVHPWQVPVLLTLLKLARISQNRSNPDSWVDAAGYIALAAELVDEADGKAD